MFFPLLSCVLVFGVKPGHGAEIIGGVEAKPHSLPYMVRVVGDKSACGGTLIHPKWVLTAAHCVGMTRVVLGVHSLPNWEGETTTRQYRNVSRWMVHPCYVDDLNFNDLMLLELDKPVEKTKTVQWLKLGKHVEMPGICSECMVAGWGATCYHSGGSSDVLRYIDVTVFNRKTCNSAEFYNNMPRIPSSMICAGSLPGEVLQSPWKGDSGAPLVCDDAVVGVVSFAFPNKPAVFNVLTSSRLKWIRKTILNYY